MTRSLADRIEQTVPELQRLGTPEVAGPILEALARAIRGEPRTLVDPRTQARRGAPAPPRRSLS
jgi:hypothetical protein